MFPRYNLKKKKIALVPSYIYKKKNVKLHRYAWTKTIDISLEVTLQIWEGNRHSFLSTEVSLLGINGHGFLSCKYKSIIQHSKYVIESKLFM